MAKLDLIIPHYKEDVALMKPMFDILRIQRNVNFDDFRVLIVCDGEDIVLPEGFGQDMPFKVDHITIPHGGISAARNAGLQASNAEWIMFCDSDDAFSSVFSLQMFFMHMKPDKVLIMSSFFEEAPSLIDGSIILLWHNGKDYVFIHGKAFRRKWVLDNNVKFNNDLKLHEDCYFVAMARHLADKKNTAYIRDPIYLWQYNKKSVSRSYDNFVLETYDELIKKNSYLIDEFLRRGMYVPAKGIACRTITDAYCRFWSTRWRKPENMELIKDAEDCVAIFMKKYGYIYRGATDLVIQAGLHDMLDPMVKRGDFDLEKAMPYEEWVKTIMEG